MHVVSDSFNDCYNKLAKMILNESEYDVSPRGQRVKETLCVSFKINSPRDRVIHNPARNFSFTYMIAELLWYISGNNKTEWISYYSKFWKDISDDGVTANSAYGSRIFKPHPRIANSSFAQWEFAKNELSKDSDTRRALIHIRTPDDSIKSKLDVPCTISIQYFVRDNKLHSVVNMRSSDLIFGISYDIPAFTFMQEMMANELGVDVGTYMHTSNSLHVYERHFGMLEKICSDENIKESEARHSRAIVPHLPCVDLPIDDLMSLESQMRKVENTHDAMSLAEQSFSNFDAYWSDWIKAITAHRIKKNGDKDIYKGILSRCDLLGAKVERS